MPIEVRNADIGRRTPDMRVIARFENASADELAGTKVSPVIWYIDKQDDSGMRGLVAELDEGIVGHILYEDFNELGILYSMYVVPENRKRGFGKKLIERAVGDLREMGVRRLEVCAEPVAIGFYEKMGFTLNEPRGPGKKAMSLAF